MSVNESRSLNTELRQGVVDGTFKQRVVNRGGKLDPHTDRRYDWPANMHIEEMGTANDVIPSFTKMRAGQHLEDLV